MATETNSLDDKYICLRCGKICDKEMMIDYMHWNELLDPEEISFIFSKNSIGKYHIVTPCCYECFKLEMCRVECQEKDRKIEDYIALGESRWKK
jgi:hypothetical protein